MGRRKVASKKRKREDEGSSGGDESKSTEELKKDSSQGDVKGKPNKAAKPKIEPEYFPEERNMVLSALRSSCFFWVHFELLF